MHQDWARSFSDQDTHARVPFFFKQFGTFETYVGWDRDDRGWRECDLISRMDTKGRWLNLAGGHGFRGERVVRVSSVGKARACQILDGVEQSAFPHSHGGPPWRT